MGTWYSSQHLWKDPNPDDGVRVYLFYRVATGCNEFTANEVVSKPHFGVMLAIGINLQVT
jgi:hypothetical protein